jgi:pimeloyl-ACP methyl ester carboxylesterase
VDPIEYDEFGLFHENAAEFGLPYDGPPVVRRAFVAVDSDRSLSALVWGDGPPELVFLHGGAQNAHTWDTVAMALGRPLVAIDLPGHGHSDRPGAWARGQLSPEGNAHDVAAVIHELAPRARGVVGMSLGGLTAITLAEIAPGLVPAVVLVDITPGVTGTKSRQISDFVNGPESFQSFAEILARTIQFNPTRTESSLRRGILHNAVQREDGSWVWRYARFRAGSDGDQPDADIDRTYPSFARLWDVVGTIHVPLMLVRGMLPQSVVNDADEDELRRRMPSVRVAHVNNAGHSVQGDAPLELAELITGFVP